MPTSAPDMIMVHRVFRREFELVPPLVRDVDEGDTIRAGQLGRHLTLVLDMLERHHEVEDVLLWPPLRERAPDRRDVIDELDSDHFVLRGSVAQVRELLAQWRADADTNGADELADAVEQLGRSLVEHLDQEECHVLPLVADLLSQQECDALAPNLLSLLQTGDAMRVLGLLNEQSPPQEWDAFRDRLPLSVRQGYVFAESDYADYAAAIRETD